MSDIPRTISSFGSGCVQVACGEHFSAAVTADGVLYTWGRSAHQLGYEPGDDDDNSGGRVAVAGGGTPGYAAGSPVQILQSSYAARKRTFHSCGLDAHVCVLLCVLSTGPCAPRPTCSPCRARSTSRAA